MFDQENDDIEEGIVQINYNQRWGQVCSREWSKSDANVACEATGRLNAVRNSSRHLRLGNTQVTANT